MARCHICGKNLGLGLLSHWVTMDRHRFCQACAELYRQEREAQVRSAVSEGGVPQCIFTMTHVRTRDPDRPKGRERLVGAAAFTDKGVCFFQTGQHLAADEGQGGLFGLIGIIISEIISRRHKKRAVAETADLFRDRQDIAKLLGSARRVLFYPLDQTSRLRFDAKGFDIWEGKRRKRFAFEGGRKAYKQIRDQALAYADDIGRGVKPAPIRTHAGAAAPASDGKA